MDAQVIGFIKLKVNMQIRVKNKILFMHKLLNRLTTCAKTFSDSRNAGGVPLNHESNQKEAETRPRSPSLHIYLCML